MEINFIYYFAVVCCFYSLGHIWCFICILLFCFYLLVLNVILFEYFAVVLWCFILFFCWGLLVFSTQCFIFIYLCPFLFIYLVILIVTRSVSQTFSDQPYFALCAFLVPVVVWYTRFLFPLVNSIFPWIVRPPAKLDEREIDLFMRAKLTRQVSKKTIRRRRLDGGWAIDIWSPLSFILLWDSFHSRSDAPLTNTGFGGEEINWFCVASVNNDWQTCLSAAALFMKENAFICRCLQTLAPQNKRLSRALWVILSPADCVYMHRHTLLQTITVERDTHTGNDCRLTQEVMSRVRLTYDPVLCP